MTTSLGMGVRMYALPACNEKGIAASVASPAAFLPPLTCCSAPRRQLTLPAMVLLISRTCCMAVLYVCAGIGVLSMRIQSKCVL